MYGLFFLNMAKQPEQFDDLLTTRVDDDAECVGDVLDCLAELLIEIEENENGDVQSK